MSNRGLVTHFIHALTVGDSGAASRLIAAKATYEGPMVGQAAGIVPLVDVITTLVNTRPSPWAVLALVEDADGAVAFRRELRVAGGVAHTDAVAARIQIHDGKIANWKERRERPLDTPHALLAEQGFTEADAAALVAREKWK